MLPAILAFALTVASQPKDEDPLPSRDALVELGVGAVVAGGSGVVAMGVFGGLLILLSLLPPPEGSTLNSQQSQALALELTPTAMVLGGLLGWAGGYILTWLLLPRIEGRRETALPGWILNVWLVPVAVLVPFAVTAPLLTLVPGVLIQRYHVVLLCGVVALGLLTLSALAVPPIQLALLLLLGEGGKPAEKSTSVER